MQTLFKTITLSLLLCSGISAAQQPIIIKFSHVVAGDTPKGKADELFKRLADERTKGRVKVEVYPNSVLYKDKEEIEALQLGAVQMLAPSTSKFGPLGVPAFEVFDLPFIFPDHAVQQRVINGPIGVKLLKLLEPKGIHGLAYWDNGFKQMTTNKPLHLPGDMKGLKLRIKGSKVLDEQMRSVGASPQVLAFSEVYQALQTGVIDGAENSLPNIYSQKFYEVQKYLTVSNHGYGAYAVIVNKKFWDGLPADLRVILEKAMKEATDFENKLTQEEEDETLQKIKASGKIEIYTLTKAESEAWRKAMLPVHKTMEKRIGAEWIQEISKEASVLGYK